MAEVEGYVCPTCGVECSVGAERCSYGHLLVEAGPPPVAVEPAPASQVVYPPGVKPPTTFSASDRQPTMTDRIIPTKNPKALIAYYCAVFAIVPCFTPVLGPVAIILGILGLKECKRNPALPGRGHALTGIILGGIMSLIVFGLIIVAIFSALLAHPSR